MTGPLSIALNGMNLASQRANTAASNIANAGATTAEGAPAAPDTDYATEIIELSQASTAYKANAAVARVASEMDREFLNHFDETV